jgi:putative hydrolase of the HAD superfamily
MPADPNPTRSPLGQTLLIDADDTLWENNIYFERAITAFISFLNHRDYTREQVREKLNEVEREHTTAHGYGVVSFRRSLIACFERLSPETITAEKHRQIESFAQAILEQEMELMIGVAETLPALAARHRLILMTKGNEAEQTAKLERSGLSNHFSAAEVVREKSRETYCEVCERHELAAANTWMIGNSPRSDINPALAAGLHAVYIHHPNTWVLEHEAMDTAPEGQQLLELTDFAQLELYF